MGRLSIGLFTYSVKPRGSVVHAACLAEALVREGADVTLYALSKSGDAFYRPLDCPLVLFPAGRAPAAADRLVEQRIGELHAGLRTIGARHDLYHAEDCLTASALLTTDVPRLRPVVRTVHHVERFENAYLAECQKRSIELSAALVSVSAFTAREVKEQFARESRVIHNGVNRARFALGPETGSAFAPNSNLAPARPPHAPHVAENDLLVLSVGGVEARKNMRRALEAVLHACRENPRVRWLIAGGSSIWDHSELEREFDARLAEQPSDIRARILRLGAVEEATLTWLYQRSDILLAPSLMEGWGLSVLEAMAARTAVICSEREPFTEFLDGECALLVDPESVDAIAGAVGQLAADSQERARLARTGELRARAFSWKRAARAHLDLYASLVRRGHANASGLRAQ